MYKKKNKTKRVYRPMRRGFSMAEVIISVFILSVSITVIFKLLSVGIKNSADSRDRIVAAQLAQEGIELVRNIRDNNMAKIKDTATGKVFDDLPSEDISNCRIDKNSGKIEKANDCADDKDLKKLYLKDGFYVHDSAGENTNYWRRIELNYDDTDADSSKLLIVTSRVIWEDGLFTCLSGKCIETKTILFKTIDDVP